MDIKEHLGVNAVVEGFLGDALDKVSFFVVEDNAAVGAMQHKAAPHRDLRVHLAVAVERAIESKDPIDRAWVAALLALLGRAILIKRLVADGGDQLAPRGLGLSE